MARWTEKRNFQGEPFMQWFPTTRDEKEPSWPSAAIPGCPICGCKYEQLEMMPGTRIMRPSKRRYMYHDREMHRAWALQSNPDSVPDLRPMREPGE